MAKKHESLSKKNSQDNLELGPLDLEDLDDGLGLPSDQDGPVRRFAVEFRKGMLSDTNAREIRRRLLHTVLPEGYSRALSEADALKRTGKDLVGDVRQELGPELSDLSAELDAHLPKIQDRVPERLYKVLEANKKRFDDSLETTQTSAGPSYSETDELRDMMAGVLEHQTETTQVRAGEEAQRASIRGKVQDAQFGIVNAQLGQLAQDSAANRAYQEQIGYKFQRKSLEVQYRSFFALRDIRRMTSESLRTLTQGFQDLVHNTALPEHLKDPSGGVKPSGSGGGLKQKTGESLSGFLSGYWGNVADTLKGDITEGIRSSSEFGNTLRQVMGAQNKAGALGMGAAQFAVPKLLDVLAPAVRSIVRPKAEEADRKTGSLGDWLAYNLTNAPAMIQEYTEDFNDTSGVGGWMKDAARRFFPSFLPNDRIEEGSYQNIEGASSFNHLTQRSIVEIIPGYLSRILQEARMLRTGDDSIEREVYDVTQGQFTGYNEARSRLMKRLVPEGSSQNIASSLNNAVERFDSEGDLSDNAQDAMRERLLRDASRNGRFNPADYIAGRGFGADVDDRTLNEISKHFAKQFDTDENGDLAMTGENNRKRMGMSDDFMFIRSMLPKPEQQIRRLMGLGSQEMIRDLGLVNNAHGRESINYDTIWSQYRSAASAQKGTGGGPDTGAFDPNQLSEDQLEQFLELPDNQLKEIIQHYPDLKRILSTAYPHDRQRFAVGNGKPKGPMSQSAKRALGMVMGMADGTTPASSTKGPATPNTAPVYDNAPTTPSQGLKAAQAAWGGAKDAVREGEPVDKAKSFWSSFQQRMKGGGQAETTTTADGSQVSVNVDTTRVEGWLEKIYGVLTNGIQIRRLPRVTYTPQEDGTTVAQSEETSEGEDKKPSGFQKSMKKIGAYYKGLFGLMGKPFKALKKSPGEGKDKGKGKGGKYVEDVYIQGQPETPVLFARDMKRGLYLDQESGETILGIDDIQGTVVRADTGNVVLTEEEAASGLYNQKGESLLKKSLKSLGSFYSNVYMKPAQAALGIVGRGLSGAVDANGPRDIYIKGEKDPRMMGRLMRKGDFYFNQETGKPIRRPKDITGTVVDKWGEVIVEDVELDALVRRDGSPLEQEGRLSKLAKLPFKMAGGLSDILAKGFKAQADMVSGIASGIGKLFGGGSGGRGYKAKVLSGMDAIYQLLDARLPREKKFREGSWQAQQAEQEATEESAQEKPGVKDRIKGGFQGFLQRMGLMGGAGALAGDDAEGDDGGDINAYRGGDRNDGGDEDDTREKRRQGKDQKKPAPKGFWNKFKHYGAKGLGKAWKVTKGVATVGMGLLGLSTLGVSGTAIGGTILSTLGVVFSAPVIATALAVGVTAAGAYGLYKGYQWLTKGDVGDLGKLRMLQYGINPDEEDAHLQKVLNLEGHYHNALNGDGTINREKISAGRIVDILGLDDQTEARYGGDWVKRRFEPVFLSHVLALNDLDESVPLDKVERLRGKSRVAFLEKVKFGGGEDSPYNVYASPFGRGEPLKVRTGDIQAWYDKLMAEAKKGGPEKHEPNAAVKVGDSVMRTLTAPISNARGDAATVSGTSNGVQTQALRGALAVAGQGNYKAKVDKTVKESLQETKEALAGGSALKTREFGQNPFNKPEALEDPFFAVVALAVGYPTRNYSELKTLQKLVQSTRDRIRVDKNGKASFTSDVVETVTRAGFVSFGYYDTNDPEKMKKFKDWFFSRFLPVVMKVKTLARQQNVEGDWPSYGWTSNKVLVSIAEGLMETKGTWKEDEVSVWALPLNPNYPVPKEMVMNLKSRAKQFVNRLREQIQDYEVPVRGTEQKGGNEQTGNGLTKSFGMWKNAMAQTNSPLNDGPLNITQSTLNTVTGNASANNFGAGGANGIAYGPQEGSSAGQGRRGQHTTLTKGNGGAWEDVPLPKRNKDRAAAMPTLRKVGSMVGVSPRLLATFASIESAFNYKAKAPTSSARGWFQFIDATWEGMLERHGSKYGIPPNASRFDPRINALMGAEFIRGNARTIANKTGRDPTDTDLYLAHFFGAGTAVKFLDANPNARAAAMFPDQAGANKAIFYKSNGRPRTIAEVFRFLDEKVSRHRSKAIKAEAGSSKESEGQGETVDNQKIDQDVLSAIEEMEAGEEKSGKSAPASGGGGSPLAGRLPGVGGASERTQNPGNTTVAGTPSPRPATPTRQQTPAEEADKEVHQKVATQRQVAEANDRRRQETAQQTARHNQEVGNYARRSYEVQVEMRDFLKQLVDLNQNGGSAGGGQSGQDGQDAARETGTRRTPDRSANTGNSPPVSMKRTT